MEERLRKVKKTQCPSRIVRCVLSSPVFVITVPPALPKSSSALQVLGHCFLSPPGDGARGSQAFRKAQCLLSSKKGTCFIRRGPRAKTQSKTAPAELGESKITPRLEHTYSSQIDTCSNKSQRATGSPFPTAPVRNAGGHGPACHLHHPARGRQPPVPRKVRPRGGMLPVPKTASVSHREQELPTPVGIPIRVRPRSWVR